MITRAVTAQALAAAGSQKGVDHLRDVDVDDFLNLLIAQLQNQDPLDPTDNSQILEQVSQIRSIQTTTQLSQTLQAVLLGQNLASAGGLISRQVRGLSDRGDEVSGTVERVSVEQGTVKLVVGGQTVELGNVREILAGETSS
jgi:flagellar basal-body rod modification protein FlgD